VDLNDLRQGKSAVIKTSTRQTIFLPIIGLVGPAKLEPGDLIGLNKDSYLVLDTLPAEYDSRVKAMEVDEKPTEVYTDIGGLNQQIEELVEAVVLPMQHQEKFKPLGIKPPKGTHPYRNLLMARCFNVRSPRNRKNSPRTSLCSPKPSHLPQTRWPATSPNVHRRRRQTQSVTRLPSQKKVPHDNLHRRARRHWHETL
jgi:26S proteasome regulatory subunit T5